MHTRSAQRALLEQSGYDVEAVATGHAALAHQAVGTYAAIILDLGLTDVSGFEVRGRRGSRHARPPHQRPEIRWLALHQQADLEHFRREPHCDAGARDSGRQ